MIGEILNGLKPYLEGVLYVDDEPLLKINIKGGWKFPKNNDMTATLNEKKSNGCNDYFIRSNSQNLDNLLNFLKEIISFNLEIEEKLKLYQEKVEELKKIFNNSSLEKLKRLRFIFDDIALDEEGFYQSQIDNSFLLPIQDVEITNIETKEPQVVITNEPTNEVIYEGEFYVNNTDIEPISNFEQPELNTSTLSEEEEREILEEEERGRRNLEILRLRKIDRNK